MTKRASICGLVMDGGPAWEGSVGAVRPLPVTTSWPVTCAQPQRQSPAGAGPPIDTLPTARIMLLNSAAWLCRNCRRHSHMSSAWSMFGNVRRRRPLRSRGKMDARPGRA